MCDTYILTPLLQKGMLACICWLTAPRIPTKSNNIELELRKSKILTFSVFFPPPCAGRAGNVQSEEDTITFGSQLSTDTFRIHFNGVTYVQETRKSQTVVQNRAAPNCIYRYVGGAINNNLWHHLTSAIGQYVYLHVGKACNFACILDTQPSPQLLQRQL